MSTQQSWIPLDENVPRDREIDLWRKYDDDEVFTSHRMTNCRYYTNSSGFTAWHSRIGGRACNVGGDENFSHWMEIPGAPE